MRTVRLWRSFPLPVRLLVANQAGVNLGFYLVLPFLAAHLADGLGMSVAAVAVVLAVRTLSQQGLFVVGGSAADRFGAHRVIVAGCAVRTAGFGLFAVAGGLPGLLAAAVLSGLAGALFNPAARAYLADAAADRRTEAFALFQASGNAGALLGPALGSALLLVDFRLVAAVAAAVFAALTLAQYAALPAQPPTRHGGSWARDWWTCLTDGRFLLFTLALSGVYTLQSQLYLVLPIQAERVTGTAAAVAVLFAAATVVSVVAQVPVTAWCRRRLRAPTTMATGLALMGAGFLVPPWWADRGGPVTTAGAAVAFVPVLAAGLLLAAGLVLVQPVVLERIGALGGRAGLSGTYFGFFYLVSGVVAAGATTAVGGVADAGSAAAPLGTAVWLLCAAIGFLCAAAVWVLDRTGLLPGETPPATAPARAGTPAPPTSLSRPENGAQ